MQFEYYVLNYNFNKKKVEPFNIFDNFLVQEYTEKAVKKYIRSPSKYEYKKSNGECIYGFEALCKEIDSIIAWEEWGRCEYEISAGYKFEKDCSKLNSFDCYEQAKMNIEMITRECIYQYKQYLKGRK